MKKFIFLVLTTFLFNQNYSLYFDGIDDYVNIDEIFNIDSEYNELSIAVRFKASNPNDIAQRIITSQN